MKTILQVSIIFFSLFAFSQQHPVGTISKSMNGKTKIFGKNYTSLTYSVEFKVSGSGCKPSKKLPIKVVIPPNGEVELYDLYPIKNKKWKCGTTYNYTVGNYKAKPNKSFTYSLPYKKGSSFKISQGYYGTFSHQKKYAIDFTMPEGTSIHAVRAGKVVKMKIDSNTGCPSKKCEDQANYIWIEHKDGTIAEYAHLKLNGTHLKLGDIVQKGDKIGLSGNTGFSQAPHLHFEIFIPTIKGNKKTISTKFKANGKVLKSLKKGTEYTNSM